MQSGDGRRGLGGVARILHPASVAVIGASEQVEKIGGRPIQLLLHSGFKGEIIPINPSRSMIQGLKAYANIAAVAGRVDLAILAVPAEIVLATLEQCGEAAVKAAVIFSSGFAEVGEAGRAEQDALLACARRYGMRFAGPNSIGIVNFADGVMLTFASSLVGPPQDGPIAIVSQSGAFGIALYSQLRERGLGIRYVCATGNQADLCIADFLFEIAKDDSQRVVLVYIEHGPDPDRLRNGIETAVAAGKCVIAVPAGLSVHGRRTAALHTGGRVDQGISPEFLEGCGAIVAEDLEDIVEKTCSVISARIAIAPRPRLVLMSNSGASCVLAADAAAKFGLALADLSESSCARLAQVLPAFSLNRNPVDLTAMLRGAPQLVPAVLDIALGDAGADVLTFGLVAAGQGYDIDGYAAACVTAMAHYGKPILVYSPHHAIRARFEAAALTTFASERQTFGYVRLLSQLSYPARALAREPADGAE